MKRLFFLLSMFYLLFACKGAGKDTPQNKEKEQEKVKLTSITIGKYSLNADELIQTQSEAGFNKEFEANFPSPTKIEITAEEGASITSEPADINSIVLLENATTITITLKKEGKLDNVCKLILSKKTSATPTPKTLPFDDMVEVNPPSAGIEGKTFNSNALEWDGVFLEGRIVKLSPYSIAKYELTYKIWHTVIEWAKTHGYKFTGQAKEALKTATVNSEPKTENLPVTQVNWYDAIIWCNAYTEMQKGQTQCVYVDANGVILKDAADKELYKQIVWDKTKKGYRLPSEAEWEYAARYQKDNSNTIGREYALGVWLTKIDTISGANKNYKDVEETAKYCWWTNVDADKAPKGVGSKLANQLGLHDMSGNMAEWVYDWYKVSEQKAETVENPEGPALNTLDENTLQKVMKGGAYNSVALTQCLPAYRNGRRRAENQGDHMDAGLRLALYR